MKSTSLSSTLYLFYVLLLNREYARAYQVISMCQTDIPLKEEETWIVKLIGQNEHDGHPGKLLPKKKPHKITSAKNIHIFFLRRSWLSPSLSFHFDPTAVS
jgi:hypothetical protein